MRVLGVADFKTMPWANGLGTTLEMMVSPAGAAMADFDWRVSSATVGADAEFSRLDGVQRSLSVLSGDGLDLTLNGSTESLTANHEPLIFEGEAHVLARLKGSAVVDLNLMTRRGKFTHEMRRLSIDGELFLENDGVTLVYVAAGSSLHADDLMVEAGQLLFCDETHFRLSSLADVGATIVYVMRLTRIDTVF